jgi:hypothetical protein
MKKLLGLACVAALTFAPAASAADKKENSQAHKDAVKTCKELRKAAGKQAFRQMYGKNGIGHCVKQETRENAAEQEQAEETAQKNASQECKAEREADAAAFQETYGTNGSKKNAFGKCVSQKAKAEREEQEEENAQEDEAQVNAAQQCREERNADREAFQDKYGTNANKRNAFGKCVSQTAREQDEQEESTEGEQGS